MMHTINIGLIGCGTVGSGVIKILRRNDEFYQKKYNVRFSVKKICDKNPAVVKNLSLHKNLFTTHIEDVLADPTIHTVVELIGGLHPAKEIILDALKHKKHVVTANKAVIAKYGNELFKSALRQKRNIFFETTVGAGVPIINVITEGLAANRFSGLYGIINGTSNFILSEMSENLCTFGEALKKAQQRGYAERNPTLDINGMDAAHKLAVLVRLALNKTVGLEQIYVEGITQISHDDIKYAKELGLVIKLLAIAKNVDGKIELRVHPTLIDEDHPLASVDGVFNAVFLHADPLGDILIYGQGAGQMTAASGVVSDLINCATKGDRIAKSRMASVAFESRLVKLRKMSQVETKFYIRFMAIDRPGVLSKITGILGRHGISIGSVHQKIQKSRFAVPVVMLTHRAKESHLRQALEKITNLSVVRSKPVAIRMETL